MDLASVMDPAPAPAPVPSTSTAPVPSTSTEQQAPATAPLEVEPPVPVPSVPVSDARDEPLPAVAAAAEALMSFPGSQPPAPTEAPAPPPPASLPTPSFPSPPPAAASSYPVPPIESQGEPSQPYLPTPPQTSSFSDMAPTPLNQTFDPIPPAEPPLPQQPHLNGGGQPASFPTGSMKRSSPDYPEDGEGESERYAKRPREEEGGAVEAAQPAPAVAPEPSVMVEHVQPATPVEQHPAPPAAAPAPVFSAPAAAPSPFPVPQPPPVEASAPAPSPAVASPAPAPLLPGSTAEVAPPAPAPGVPQAPLAAPGQYVVGSYQPEPRPRFGPTSPLNQVQYRSLISQIRQMKKLKEANVFLIPVDPIAGGIPHYPVVVTKPMDLGTVEAKLVNSNPNPNPKDKSKKPLDPSLGKYESVADVVDDVRQIWINTKIFNGPDHWVTTFAKKVEDVFETYLQKAPLQEAPIAAPTPPAAPPVAAPSPSAEHVRSRRPSVSIPTIRRNPSDDNVGEGSRPKREIHPPTPKDLAWSDADYFNKKGSREGQIDWVRKQIESLTKKKENWLFVEPFMEPVNWQLYGLFDYPKVVKRPMDISTIQRNISNHVYQDADEINADFNLMIDNCLIYNAPGTPVEMSGQHMKKVWEEKWAARPWVQPKPVEGHAGSDDEELREIDRQIARLHAKREELLKHRKDHRDTKERAKAAGAVNGAKQLKHGHGAAHKPKTPKAPKPAGHKPKKQSGSAGGAGANGRAANGGSGRKSSMAHYDAESEDEIPDLPQDKKHALADGIGNTPPEILQQAIQIIQETTSVGDNGEEIELDIDALPAATVHRLYNLVMHGEDRPYKKSRKGPGSGKKSKSGGPGRGVKKSEAEQQRLKAMEEQLVANDDDDDDAASSVAYSEEEYSDAEE